MRQCLAFRLAGFLGVLLALVSGLERDWVSLAIGLTGTTTMVVVYRRRCRRRPEL
ncbi:MAG: hypothetical protein M3327_15065 [Actinomycetota bacterium]|nr:hypothetical protein [Actinomycetota bacterium]